MLFILKGVILYYFEKKKHKKKPPETNQKTPQAKTRWFYDTFSPKKKMFLKKRCRDKMITYFQNKVRTQTGLERL